ncbi:GIY-YIG nuclease family protein [Paenibacillus profundus]|uniref:GIY-YIG nuclease family protein n=1 Tax=Paenibacillus profundus TaxID=1173085 RepID=A0ABS8YIV6_9BACL|nr:MULTISPECIES: GIY-YIG nuclease family protein [Paenibacillus]MCE5170393.1 GIY-YIG nuclease family protein [Paenibacillus profundus]
MKPEERKQAGNLYAHSHRLMGVYGLKHKQSGKWFIASAMNVEGKRNGLYFTLNMGGHINKRLSEDWKRDGEDAFEFHLLEELKPEEEYVANDEDRKKYVSRLKKLEEQWLNKLQPYEENGYHNRPADK